MSSRLKIAVIGAGAVGGNVGGRLARAGEDVTFIARGETLAALKSKGFALIDPKGEQHWPTVKAASIDDAGTFDLVFLTLKAHQIAAVAPSLSGLLKPGAAVAALQNGMPWWYFHKCGGAFEGQRVEAVDPGGVIGRAIDPARIIGGVIYVAAAVVCPGVVRVNDLGKVVLGEPDGSISERIIVAAAALKGAGIDTTISPAIRTDIWVKLWGNLAFNPVSALTRATLLDMAEDPPVLAVVTAMMAEAEQVAAKIGVRMPISLQRRVDITAALGRHKTSTLQDIEAARAPELEAMVGAVVELARLTGVATPTLDAIYACADLLARTVTRS